MQLLEYIQENQWARNAIASALLMGAVVLLRWILLRQLSRATIRSAELRRRWAVQIRNAFWLFLLEILSKVVFSRVEERRRILLRDFISPAARRGHKDTP